MTPPLVLHVLPLDIARGAQTHAKILRDALNGPDVRHRTLILFRGPPAVMNADFTLGVANGRLRETGFDPRALVALRRAIRLLEPAVVIAHGGEPLLYCGLAVPRQTPLIYYRIGGLAKKVRGRVRGALYRRLVRRADVVAGVSDETLVDARVVLGADPAKLRLVPNGRDPYVFAAKSAPVGDPARLLWVGHLAPGKGAELFVRIVRDLRSQRADVEASLVGDGPLASVIEHDAAAARVAMLGRRDDVADLLAASDIVCFTSTGVEGLPGVLIEAGLSGRPVVSTDVDGSRTVVEDGVTGFVVDRHDPSAFVAAVRRLVDDVELRQRMGAAGRIRCAERFTLAASAEQWRGLLDGVLHPATPAGS